MYRSIYYCIDKYINVSTNILVYRSIYKGMTKAMTCYSARAIFNSTVSLLESYICGFFIMTNGIDQKNNRDIMEIMVVNIVNSLRSDSHYENNADRYSRHFST